MKSFSATNTNCNPDPLLLAFAGQVLASQGAVVETAAGGLEALLPEPLARRLDLPEHLAIDTGLNEPGAPALAYGSPLLEKIIDLACSQVPVLDCRLVFAYIKRQGFDRLIGDQFRMVGAVGRVTSIAEVRSRHLVLYCRYLAQSDEQKEDLLPLAFNLDTGAPVHAMAGLLESLDRDFTDDGTAEGLDAEKAAAVVAWIQKGAVSAVEAAIASFRATMDRRFHRDAAHLESYYASLGAEMETLLKRPGLSAEAIADRQAKIDLIPAELTRKKEDLHRKYSIHVQLFLCGAVLVRTPAVKVILDIAVGRKTKTLPLIYNPVLKALEPMVCQGCGAGTYSLRFCDRLHTLCPACAPRCPLCNSPAEPGPKGQGRSPRSRAVDDGRQVAGPEPVVDVDHRHV
jgi:hypothetical protein